MASSPWLSSVQFEPSLRRELSGYLRNHDAAAIIASLETVVQTAPVFRRQPRRQSISDTFRELKATAAKLRKQLADLAEDEATGDEITNAVALLGRDPVKFRTSLIEGLDVLDDAIERAQEVQPGSGGRPRDLEATWLVEQVAETLKRHDVRVTNDEDGVCARVLRALWPHALPGREAPIELKPWFKLLKLQR